MAPTSLRKCMDTGKVKLIQQLTQQVCERGMGAFLNVTFNPVLYVGHAAAKCQIGQFIQGLIAHMGFDIDMSMSPPLCYLQKRRERLCGGRRAYI